MLQNMLCAVAVAAMAITTEAMADSSTNSRQQDAHAAAYSMPQHRRWHAHRSFTHGFGAGPAAYYGYASAFREPSYINVPRILDGACNLPTSACPNEFRNVN